VLGAGLLTSALSTPHLEDQVERRLRGAPEVRESGLAEHVLQLFGPGLSTEHELAAFFRRLFKRTTGLAPSAYRKRFTAPEFARP
jgi:hypothetical protein